MIGSGASLKHGISVGNRCVIGTGSAVVADIEDNTVAYGNPARPKKRNSE
jgi:acetyltransferase-like isoleucine patch superfamily enzyme